MNPEQPTTLAVPVNAAARSAFRVPRSKQSGFTLIELIVVVTIIGILAGVAVVQVKYAQRKAREAALKDNLYKLRGAIDNFYADKQRYPNDLQELVPNYIRKVPPDPITMQPDWDVVMDDPTDEQNADPDPEAVTQPGVIDVKSKAPGATLDGVPYAEL